MTEKRFTNTDNGFIVDYESKQKVLNLYDVVELLNELHEENEQLKARLNDLNDENEWLKSEIQKLYNFVKIDVEHNIEVYPKSLMEHILGILKIIGDLE